MGTPWFTANCPSRSYLPVLVPEVTSEGMCQRSPSSGGRVVGQYPAPSWIYAGAHVGKQMAMDLIH